MFASHRISAVSAMFFGVAGALACVSPRSDGATEGMTASSLVAARPGVAPNAPGAANPSPDTPVAAQPASTAAIEGRPSTDDNMGRNFQGRIQLRITPHQQPPRTLRYMSRGNASRLQIEAKEKPIDLLFANNDLYALDHTKKTYQRVNLADVKERDTDSVSGVKSERLSERNTIKGVVCDDWKIEQGALQIDACVASLPGTFNIDKFETATNLEVPAWVEELFDDDFMPISAVAKQNGQPVYEFVLEEYSPGPVEVEVLTLPANYKSL